MAEKKRKMSKVKIKKAKAMAEKMKGHSEIENPHALARYMVNKKKSKVKRKKGGY